MPRFLTVVVAIALPALLACTPGPESARPPTQSSPSAGHSSTESAHPGGAAAKHHPPNIHNVSITWARVRSGFSAPTQVTSAPDGTRRLFVVQKGGSVKVVKGSKVLGHPYLNITPRVDAAGEGGLLSIAFSPNFHKNGRLWVAYSRRSDGDLVIARMQARHAQSNHVRSSTLHTVLRVEHSEQVNHFGGQLAFGPDGYLYVGTGDGGGSGNYLQTAGDRHSVRGKILRLDVSKACDHKGYCIPHGNPYVGKPGRDEIWLLGLRNPWRFSFDSATKALWIGDVGQDAVEEIDRVRANPPRRNLGWSCREGDRPYPSPTPCPARARYLNPVTTVDHPAAEAIIGGFVYRGNKYRHRLGGVYIFGDEVTSGVWLYHRGQGKVLQAQRLGPSAGVTSFGVDDAGEIYAVTYDGTLWQMRAHHR